MLMVIVDCKKGYILAKSCLNYDPGLLRLSGEPNYCHNIEETRTWSLLLLDYCICKDYQLVCFPSDQSCASVDWNYF